MPSEQGYQGFLPSAKFATGSYTGDGTVFQSITGIGFAPKFLYLFGLNTDTTGTFMSLFNGVLPVITWWDPIDTVVYQNLIPCQQLDSNGFSVNSTGFNTAYPAGLTTLGETFYWVAFA